MIDQNIRQQLEGLFKELPHQITLSVQPSTHRLQVDLLNLLGDVARTSPFIDVKTEGEEVDGVHFRLLKDGQATGISFRGIPSGHEFTSLILAVLNSCGKGKLPDEGLQQRIKNLKGPIRLRTFVSMSCENCPDVVQTLNQLALIHDDFAHEMVDGALFQDEVSRLNIAGVPSVVHGEELLFSGKSTLAEIIGRLEEAFGARDDASAQVIQEHFDVAIVGGGPAGVSAAIYSARKGLRTVVIAETIGGQVKETKGIENIIALAYIEGDQLSDDLHKRLDSNGVVVKEHRLVEQIRADKNQLSLTGGEVITADDIILATGAKWRKLNVPGEKDYIGRGVAYCPHCDGPYYKGKEVAVIGGGNSGVEAAIDLAQITQSVTLIEYADGLKADQVLVDKLQTLPNVKVMVATMTTEIVGDGEKVVALKVKDRESGAEEVLDLDGVFVQIGLAPNSGPFKGVVDINKFGEIIVDDKGRTSVPRIYAAGDVTTSPYKQIVTSMGDGAKAALSAFEGRMRAANG